MNEDQVIEQLTNYRQIVARIQLLANYSLGSGITVSRLNQDDQLQDLHRQLRGLPSYMYLGKREQRLETAAHAYLTEYPAGTRAQLQSIPRRGVDAEDEELLRELRSKIEKVIEARTGRRSDFDAVLERISELQDLQAEKQQIDNVLEALEGYKPEYAKLLRGLFVEERHWADVGKEMHLSKDGVYRIRKKAIAEYASLVV